MDVGEVLRAVRRLRGWSQRDLARAAEVPLSCVTAAEAGRRALSTATLDRVLAAADLDLQLTGRTSQDGDAVLGRWLRLSTSQRLWVSLGGQGGLRSQRCPAFTELRRLAASPHNRLGLVGRQALGVWLPGVLVPLPVELAVEGALPELHDARLVRPVAASAAVATAAVGLDDTRLVVHVATPAALLLDEDCRPQHAALHRVLALLHRDGARDDAGRRVPAHRDPDLEQEGYRVRHTRWTLPAEPSLLDARTWRLGGAASAAQALRRAGVEPPVRRPA